MRQIKPLPRKSSAPQHQDTVCSTILVFYVSFHYPCAPITEMTVGRSAYQRFLWMFPLLAPPVCPSPTPSHHGDAHLVPVSVDWRAPQRGPRVRDNSLVRLSLSGVWGRRASGWLRWKDRVSVTSDSWRIHITFTPLS